MANGFWGAFSAPQATLEKTGLGRVAKRVDLGRDILSETTEERKARMKREKKSGWARLGGGLLGGLATLAVIGSGGTTLPLLALAGLGGAGAGVGSRLAQGLFAGDKIGPGKFNIAKDEEFEEDYKSAMTSRSLSDALTAASLIYANPKQATTLASKLGSLGKTTVPKASTAMQLEGLTNQIGGNQLRIPEVAVLGKRGAFGSADAGWSLNANVPQLENVMKTNSYMPNDILDYLFSEQQQSVKTKIPELLQAISPKPRGLKLSSQIPAPQKYPNSYGSGEWNPILEDLLIRVGY